MKQDLRQNKHEKSESPLPCLESMLYFRKGTRQTQQTPTKECISQAGLQATKKKQNSLSSSTNPSLERNHNNCSLPQQDMMQPNNYFWRYLKIEQPQKNSYRHSTQK